MRSERDPVSEQDMRNLARQVVAQRIAPNAMARDQEQTFPSENLRPLADADLLGVVISEQSGGVGLGRPAFTLVAEEIGAACASTALVYVTHVIVEKAIELFANEAARKMWLPDMLKGQRLGALAVHEPESGSNSAAITTRAMKDGDAYIVNGSKFFITSAGEADIYLVLVRTNPDAGPKGMSMLLIKKDTPGLSFGRPEDKLGLRSTSSRQMFFDNCRVPSENIMGTEGQGPQVMAKAVVGWGFFGAAAISVGIAKSAAALSVKHARERTIAGQAIGTQQGVQFLISDMIVAVAAAEALLARCAANADSAPETAVLNAFEAKLFASEIAVEVTHKAIQVLGGHGYCRDYVVERLFRDARGLMLHFKTSEWLRQDIAKAVLKL